MAEKIRLQKVLASRGLASRRGAEDLIAQGLVKVNGVVVTAMGVMVDPGLDLVEVDAGALKKREAQKTVVMLHKPQGYVTSKDRREGRIVMSLVADHPLVQDLNPVGRLDKDSTGLLLLTNDGILHYSLMDPEKHSPKEYLVATSPPPKLGQIKKMAQGMVIEGKQTRPARAWPDGADSFRIVLTEGRNRQIRKMCQKVGLEVKSLKRVRVGKVMLGDLREGKWRELSEREIKLLKGESI
jgi:23S rRNA pseudouridine2605 synthase